MAIAQEDWASCRFINNATERLDCYDRFAKAANPPLDDPAISVCERSIVSHLRSPSSYKRIKAQIVGNVVSISFDAQNTFGALVRDEISCGFERKGDFIKQRYPAISPDDLSSNTYPIRAASTHLVVEETPDLPAAVKQIGEFEARNICAEKLGIKRSDEFKITVITNAAGGRSIYFRPTSGKSPFEVGVCEFSITQLTSAKSW